MLPQFKKDFLEKISSDEMLKFNELWAIVERQGLTFEVIHTALEEMKSNPSSSPLLCLQIAAEDWDC
jgi:hypothetical protein|tara:strand:+ start:1943 stop:2143 length:201 start_codon:yes stop_codon:yes gene_type:complete